MIEDDQAPRFPHALQTDELKVRDELMRVEVPGHQDVGDGADAEFPAPGDVPLGKGEEIVEEDLKLMSPRTRSRREDEIDLPALRGDRVVDERDVLAALDLD